MFYSLYPGLQKRSKSVHIGKNSTFNGTNFCQQGAQRPEGIVLQFPFRGNSTKLFQFGFRYANPKKINKKYVTRRTTGRFYASLSSAFPVICLCGGRLPLFNVSRHSFKLFPTYSFICGIHPQIDFATFNAERLLAP